MRLKQYIAVLQTLYIEHGDVDVLILNARNVTQSKMLLTEEVKDPTVAFIKKKTRINSPLDVVYDPLHALAGEKVLKL